MKTKQRIQALILCLLLLAMLFAGCSPDKGEKAPEESEADENALETDIVRMAMPANGHVLNAIAEKQGYLADEGLTVIYVPIETDQDAFDGIRNGTIDIASNQGTNLPLEQISKGEDLTIFGGYLLTGCMPIFTRADVEWNGIEDLIGKTMACEPNLYAITGPLLDMGHDPLHDIKWYETKRQTDRITAVEKGQADYGLVGTALNYNVRKNRNLKIVGYASDVLPFYSCCRAEANTEWVRSHPNTVKALLRAWIRAQAYYETHPDEAVELMCEFTGADERYIRAFMDNEHFYVCADPMQSSVERAWDYLNRLGLLDKDAQKINIDDHIEVRLYKEALDECQQKYGADEPEFYQKMQKMYEDHNQGSGE